MLDFSEVNLPFSVTDLISSGNGLLSLIGPFVLLGMAFVFVPLVIYLITQTISVHNNNKQGYHPDSVGRRVSAHWQELTYRFKN